MSDSSPEKVTARLLQVLPEVADTHTIYLKPGEVVVAREPVSSVDEK